MSSAPAQATREVACLVVMLSNADAAPLSPSPEDRYIATRDAAIERLSSIHDADRFEDAAKKGAHAARADLQAQMSAILGELNRKGFGAAVVNFAPLPIAKPASATFACGMLAAAMGR